MLRQKEVLDRDETGMVFECQDNNNFCHFPLANQ